MGDLIYPNEALINMLLAFIYGQDAGGASVIVDLVEAPTTAPDNGSTYGSLTLGVVNGDFSATSPNASGTNVLSFPDFTTQVLVGNDALIGAGLITFTNIAVVPKDIYAWVMYVPISFPAGTPPLLVSIQGYLPAPVTVPPAGVLVVNPQLGGNSKFLS